MRRSQMRIMRAFTCCPTILHFLRRGMESLIHRAGLARRSRLSLCSKSTCQSEPTCLLTHPCGSWANRSNSRPVAKQTAAEQNSHDRSRSIHREKWGQECDLWTKSKRERQQVHEKDRAGKQK